MIAPTAAAQRPLENIANNSAPAGHSVAAPVLGSDGYRVERWQARGVLWHESSLKRVRSCGRWAITSDGSVQVRSNGQAVGYAGLASCGSVWACPVCNARIQAVRRIEVGTALAWALSDGAAAFGAYTLQHHATSNLDGLWRSLSKVWNSVAVDKSVRGIRAELGHVGVIRAAETTHGRNGWHPHLHPLHLFSRPVTASDVEALHRAQFRAWEAAAGRVGLVAPSARAQNLHLVGGAAAHAEVADYFTKASYAPTAEAVGWEMTSTQTKSRARAEDSRTPWEILRAVHVDGDADSLDLWHGWERGSKGKRAVTWSRGLRSLVGLDAEATDEDIAAAEVGSSADAGFVITDWSPVRANPRLGAELLSAIGSAGRWNDGRRFCRLHGIETQEVTS